MTAQADAVSTSIAHYQLAVSHQRNGRKDQAKAECQTALAVYLGSDDAGSVATRTGVIQTAPVIRGTARLEYEYHRLAQIRARRVLQKWEAGGKPGELARRRGMMETTRYRRTRKSACITQHACLLRTQPASPML